MAFFLYNEDDESNNDDNIDIGDVVQWSRLSESFLCEVAVSSCGV